MKVEFSLTVYALKPGFKFPVGDENILNIPSTCIEASIIQDMPDGYPQAGAEFEFIDHDGNVIYEALTAEFVRHQVGIRKDQGKKYDCYIAMETIYVESDTGDYILSSLQNSGWSCITTEYPGA